MNSKYYTATPSPTLGGYAILKPNGQGYCLDGEGLDIGFSNGMDALKAATILNAMVPVQADPDCLDEFMQAKGVFDDFLAQLGATSENHFGCDPESITSAEVEMVTSFSGDLRAIAAEFEDPA